MPDEEDEILKFVKDNRENIFKEQREFFGELSQMQGPPTREDIEAFNRLRSLSCK